MATVDELAAKRFEAARKADIESQTSRQTIALEKIADMFGEIRPKWTSMLIEQPITGTWVAAFNENEIPSIIPVTIHIAGINPGWDADVTHWFSLPPLPYLKTGN